MLDRKERNTDSSCRYSEIQIAQMKPTRISSFRIRYRKVVLSCSESSSSHIRTSACYSESLLRLQRLQWLAIILRPSISAALALCFELLMADPSAPLAGRIIQHPHASPSQVLIEYLLGTQFKSSVSLRYSLLPSIVNFEICTLYEDRRRNSQLIVSPRKRKVLCPLSAATNIRRDQFVPVTFSIQF